MRNSIQVKPLLPRPPGHKHQQDEQYSHFQQRAHSRERLPIPAGGRRMRIPPMDPAPVLADVKNSLGPCSGRDGFVCDNVGRLLAYERCV